MVAKSITQLIGDTPIIEIEEGLYAKCEFFNPGGSVKDRIALFMIQEAVKKGRITNSTKLVEPTSGNTGIGLAMVAASMSLDLTIVMPESMSVERRKLLRHLGANLILTPAKEGMKGAIAKAKELEAKGYVMLSQFSNLANPKAHEETTAKEILADLPDLDIFVAGVGTGGTITGVGRVLKKRGVKIVAVEPTKSAVLSGKEPGSHKIQGIGAGFIPDIVDQELFDAIVTISEEEAIQTSKELAKNHGLLVGISAGANVAAAKKMKQKGQKVLTILPDGAERYLSTELFD